MFRRFLHLLPALRCSFFFFNDTATTEIYTLSLHDALPILAAPALAPERVAFTDFDEFWEFVSGPLNAGVFGQNDLDGTFGPQAVFVHAPPTQNRSEEHTSELQSHLNLVCRLLLEKKKTTSK